MKTTSWQMRAELSGMSRLEFAAAVWRDRQKKPPAGAKPGDKAMAIYLQSRQFRPLGVTQKGMGYWYPMPVECRPCCSEMEHPPPKFPWAYKTHCNTARHVAALFGLDERELLKHLGIGSKPPRCAQCSRFRRKDDYLCGTCRQGIDENIPA